MLRIKGKKTHKNGRANENSNEQSRTEQHFRVRERERERKKQKIQRIKGNKINNSREEQIQMSPDFLI